MSRFDHELISASAGTGKTYQLTVRYLRLLFATGEPERIIALTFTRKAAGEFFEKIFHRLACAAADPKEAAALSKDLGTTVTCANCLARLRLLLDRLHRLQLSTYDSFFSRVVQSFPYELGLGAPPELIDDRQRAEVARKAQEELLTIEEGQTERLQEFWHAFKRATMGREEKRTTDLLDAFIEEHQSLFLEEPNAERWGNPAAIWPRGCPWRDTGEDPAKLSAAFKSALPWANLSATQIADLQTFLVELAEWQPPAEMPGAVRKFVVKFLEILPDLDRGSATITVRRKLQLSAELCDLGARLARTGVWMELAPRLVATRGIQELIALFEGIYREDVRGRGLLTIGDMTRLLADGAGGRGVDEPDLRQQMSYRLDGAFDHWLLDEFQDTSHAQWRAIEGLVDEVLQDPEGRRSFFAVGDTKQCLYMWRGSDDKLFDRVAGHYAASLEQRKLADSYRSAAPVLGMVNGVFSASAALAEICGEAVSARWSRMWTEHRCAPHLKGASGYACWLLSEDKNEIRHRDLLRLIQGLDPLARGLSVAVLTQTNAVAETIVDFLRREGNVPCSLAADVHPGSDNGASIALHCYLRVTAHPGDKLAWACLKMTPLGPELVRRHGDATRLAEHVRHRIFETGMQGAVAEWAALAAAHIAPENRFSPERIAQCEAVAREVDVRGEADIDAFLRELKALSLRESDVPGQVAVMTVHKAKGLDWDIVILPDLEGNSLRERRHSLAVKRDTDGAVEWILQAPRKDLASCDTVLGEQIEEAERDAAFEQLCVLYVAMTRARLGLVVFTSDPKKTKSPNFVSLLDRSIGAQPRDRVLGGQTFTCAWEDGTPAGIEQAQPAHPFFAAQEWTLNAIDLKERRPCPRFSSLRPSDNVDSSEQCPLWRPDAGGLAFGVAVHAALARVEWLPADPATAAAELDRLFADCEESVRSAARRIVSAATRVFQRPDDAVELWRERAFEVIDGNRWISGQFDRVVIHRDSGGVSRSALLIDFKSGVHADRQHYSWQMGLYRVALANLLELSSDAIELQLLTPA